MKTKIIALTFLVLFSFSSSFILASGQNASLGIVKGTTLFYTTTHTIYSEASDQQNFTFSLQFSIDDISEQTVTISRIPEAHYNLDLTNGYFFFDENNIPFILFSPPNLNTGDSFHTFSSSHWTMNETIVRIYGTESRETTHFSQIMEITPQLHTSADFYFDKKTGVLVEYVTAGNSTNLFDDFGNPIAPYRVIDREVLTKTSLWSIPERTIPATVDCKPDSYNLMRQSGEATVYIQLSQGYSVEDIDISTIKLNCELSALKKPTSIGDYNNDGISDLMVKFRLPTAFLPVSDKFTDVTLVVSGYLKDGTFFTGSDTIKVISN